jgi:hypothetical protein
MLAARATTKAISLYAPGVLRGIVAPAGRVAQVEWDDDEAPPAPTERREPPIEDEERAVILAQLDALEGTEDLTRLRGLCRYYAIPNLRSDRVTRAHGALVRRLIVEVMAESESETARAHQPSPGDEPVPSQVHDDLPEANGATEDQPPSYDPPTEEDADPGRPF